MLKTIFLAVAAALMWLPILQMATSFAPQFPLEENRVLAPRPVFKSWRTSNQYLVDTVKWFNDQYGFRDFLIRSKTQVDYSAFRVSSKVHVGKDGWLFYRSVVDVQKPKTEMLLKKDSDAVISGVSNLAQALQQRGIKLVVMICPMKDVYYGQYLPRAVRQRRTAPGQAELLQQRMKSLDSLILIDNYAILRDLAAQRRVFHQTDFHWNDPAAFEVARALVERLAREEGRPVPLWKHALSIEQKPLSGGEAAFMPLFFPPKEIGLFVKPDWVMAPARYDDKKKPFEYVYEMTSPSGNELGPVAVLGDSFFDGMVRSGLLNYFGRVYRANWNAATLDQFMGALPVDTRYVLLELIETEDRAYAALAARGNSREAGAGAPK
jgi:hypothetical protein